MGEHWDVFKHLMMIYFKMCHLKIKTVKSQDENSIQVMPNIDLK